ncbi:MAG: phage portal protein [bacterium]|nr:phage portal protein [bacterium]
MLRRIREWLGMDSETQSAAIARARWLPRMDLPATPLSKPFTDERLPFWEREDGLIPPPGVDPRALFPLLRDLRDYIPDVSAGVWAWVRLCATPMARTLSGNEADRDEANEILNELDARVYGGFREQERGVESLTRALFLSAFTYGAFCGEIVLTENRRRIDRFIVIDPATIRFRLDPVSRRHVPYQIQPGGGLTALNPASFYYYGLDADGLSPYGRSPLLSLPLVIKLQQQMIRDMAKAQRNAGYPTIHFKIKPAPRERGESLNDYHERLQTEMDALRGEIECKQSDSNLLTYDNVEVQYIGPGGRGLQWTESMQAVSEQVVSALHLAPFMIGRNWGTTESWGAAQYQLVVNNARTVQEGGRQLAGWLMNLELALHGSPVRAETHFAPHHHVDLTQRAKAFEAFSRALVSLRDNGLLAPDAAQSRVDAIMRFM